MKNRSDLKIYSNCGEVELRLNGESLGTRISTDRRFIWTNVALQPGPNRLYAIARTGGQSKATDSCSWTYTTGTPYHPPAP